MFYLCTRKPGASARGINGRRADQPPAPSPMRLPARRRSPAGGGRPHERANRCLAVQAIVLFLLWPTPAFRAVALVVDGSGGGEPAAGAVTHRALVMLAYFAGQTPPTAIDATSVQTLMFGNLSPSVSGYYRENSYGRFQLDGEVHGWYQLPIGSTCVIKDLILAAVNTLRVSDANVHFLDYQHFMVIAPYTNVACGDGTSLLGASPFLTPDGTVIGSRAVIRAGSATLYSLAHELGHGLGLHHAGLLNCDLAVTAAAQCPVWEYGDHFDLMGGAYETMGGHFDALHKERLGWLDGAGIVTVTGSGTYTLQPLETSSTGVKALNISRGDGSALSVEYRQPLGYDRDLDDPAVFSGALLHISGDGGKTLLVDPTPPAYVRENVLRPGASFTDVQSGVRLTTVEATPERLIIRADFPRTAKPLPIGGERTE